MQPIALSKYTVAKYSWWTEKLPRSGWYQRHEQEVPRIRGSKFGEMKSTTLTSGENVTGSPWKRAQRAYPDTDV